MESDVAIETFPLSTKKNHDEYYPNLTEAIMVEEADIWLEVTNIKTSTWEKSGIWIKFNKLYLTTNTKIIP